MPVLKNISFGISFIQGWRTNFTQKRLTRVGRFAAGIAHDFNNILTGIIGFDQYLQTKPSIPDYERDHSNKIDEQGMRTDDEPFYR